MVNEGFVSVKEKVIGMGIKILFSRKIEAPCYTRSFSEYVRMRLSLYKCYIVRTQRLGKLRRQRVDLTLRILSL